MIRPGDIWHLGDGASLKVYVALTEVTSKLTDELVPTLLGEQWLMLGTDDNDLRLRSESYMQSHRRWHRVEDCKGDVR